MWALEHKSQLSQTPEPLYVQYNAKIKQISEYKPLKPLISPTYQLSHNPQSSLNPSNLHQLPTHDTSRTSTGHAILE